MDIDVFFAAFNSLKDDPDLSRFLAWSDGKAKLASPSVKLIYPKFREDAPDIEALAEYLWSQAINYVVPLHKRRQARERSGGSGGDLSTITRLLAETKRAFLSYNEKHPGRASEVGELLAFLLALEYLQAAQLACKMALKTNGNMPVHGLDGIHARFDDGLMTLFFLESKLSASANEGARICEVHKRFLE